MKLYLLNLLQSNELEDVMNDKMAKLVEKHNAVLYQSDPKDFLKYLSQFAFEHEEDREAFADEIPQLAFEYADLYDYPEGTWKAYKSGEKKVDVNPMPKDHKPTQHEKNIEEWLKKNDFKYKKLWFDVIEIDYVITLPNGKNAIIMLEYKGKFVMGGAANGSLVGCRQKEYVGEALQKIFSEIEKESGFAVVD